MAACLCSPCGRSFTGLTAFDRHHDVDYRRDPPVRCMDPATVGLVRQSSGRWGLPIDPAARERLRTLRDKPSRDDGRGRSAPDIQA